MGITRRFFLLMATVLGWAGDQEQITTEKVQNTINEAIGSDAVDISTILEESDGVYFAKDFPGGDGGEQIQNALNTGASKNEKNAVIITPSGPDNPSSAPERNIWEVSSHIDLEGKDNTIIIGIGYPMLFLADCAEDDIIRTSEDGNGEPTTNVTIKGIRFHGNKSNNETDGEDPTGSPQTLKGLSGIRPVNCAEWLIEDCSFEQFTRYGYCAKLTQGAMTVRDCTGESMGDDAFTVTNQFFNTQDPDGASHLFENCVGRYCDDQGIEIEDGAQHVTIRDSRFEHNDNRGASVKSHVSATATSEQPVSDVSFENCEFISNHNGGMQFQAGENGDSANHRVDDCSIIADSGHGIGFGIDFDGIETLQNIVIKDTNITLDGASTALFTRGGNRIKDLEINIQVQVLDADAVANRIINLIDTEIDRVTIRAKVDGGSANAHGVVIQSNSGPINDVTITEDTLVRNCGGCGLLLQSVGDNSLTNGVIGGVYKNNGQETTKPGTLRCGVRLWEGAGTLSGFVCSNVRAYDDRETKTQLYGILPNASNSIFEANNLVGNAKGGYQQNPPGTSIKEGRGFNDGDPRRNGQWKNEAARAEEYNVIVEDISRESFYRTSFYRAVDGSWVPMDR